LFEPWYGRYADPMSYQGRSPLKDVVRSVVMGAAMISPALLAACGGAAPVTTAPTMAEPPAATGAVATVAIEPSTPPPEPSAPPNDVVRPRDSDGGTTMPTRGFCGAARARA
jgi:hypothetical protein